MRVAFATYAALKELTPSDQRAADELYRRGVAVTGLPWTTTCDWREFDAVIIRATWDYYTRPGEYLAWLQVIEEHGIPLWNPAPLARWNMNKRYLRELERASVWTVPTEWVSSTAEHSLKEIVRKRGWADVVVKPVISASANETWRIQRDVTQEDERRLRTLLGNGDAMVQPFIDSIAAEGEWSFIFLGGEFSHAVLKRPADGDFRVQAAHGGTAISAHPKDHWLDQARLILDALPWPWLYARVDGCIVDGRFMLVELEMLEPDLFLNLNAAAPARFADSLLELLTGKH
jgi:glutathione synthase/RimK-type ligase-like ATP-grasp enzyme